MEVNKNDSKEKAKLIKLVFKVILLALIILWIFRFLLGDMYQHVLRQIISTSRTGVLILIGLEIIFICLDSVTITLIVKRYKRDYSYGEGLDVLLYGNFYKGITFGSGTMVARLYLLNKQEVPAGISSGMLTVQSLFHRLAVIMNATVFMVSFNVFRLFDFATYRPYFILGYCMNFIMMTGTVFICTWKEFHQIILAVIQKVLRAVKKEDYLREVEIYFRDLEKESRFLLEKTGWCLKLILINSIKLMFWYVMPYVIYISVTGSKPGASLVEIMTLTAMMHLLLGVIPTPVGMGSTEVVYLILFSHLFGKVTASTTMIIYRLFTYYMPFVLSILFMLIYSYMQKKRKTSEQESRVYHRIIERFK